MKSDRTILITGVTGNQGGAVAQALQGTEFHLRGLTRKPDSERAAALARHGVDIVKGDLDEATLRRALAGAWGVFGVQNAGEAGVEREEAQGKRLATLAREAGSGAADEPRRRPFGEQQLSGCRRDRWQLSRNGSGFCGNCARDRSRT
jgi:uncharacterized protein YbjT (DUF2867 family)